MTKNIISKELADAIDIPLDMSVVQLATMCRVESEDQPEQGA